MANEIENIKGNTPNCLNPREMPVEVPATNEPLNKDDAIARVEKALKPISVNEEKI